MSYLDDILSKRGLKFEELYPEEQETLNTWMSALDRGQVNIPIVREFISKMRDSVSQGLSELEETPTTWLSLLCFLIPLIGIIRKWYLDQKRVSMTARLRNYVLLEAFLSTPERAKAAMEKAVASLSSGKSR